MPVCMFKDTVLTGLIGGTASLQSVTAFSPPKWNLFFLTQCTHQVFVPIIIFFKCQQQHSVSNQLQLTFKKYTIMRFLCKKKKKRKKKKNGCFCQRLEDWLTEVSKLNWIRTKMALTWIAFEWQLCNCVNGNIFFFYPDVFPFFLPLHVPPSNLLSFLPWRRKGSLSLVLVPSCTWQHSKYAPFFLSHVSSPTVSLCFVLKMVYMCVTGVMLYNIPNWSISLLLACWFFCPLSYLILIFFFFEIIIQTQLKKKEKTHHKQETSVDLIITGLLTYLKCELTCK